MPDSFSSFLSAIWLGNTMQQYMTSLVTFLALFLLSFLFQFPLLGWLKRKAEATDTDADDFVIEQIKKNLLPLMYFASLYFSVQTLNRSEQFTKGMEMVGTAALVFFVIRFVTAQIKFWLTRRWEKTPGEKGKSSQVKGLVPAANVIIWAIGLLFLLDNFGLDLTTVAAGLGIGGVAVALAAQVILKDLFSYFSILMDKPFDVGDTIHLGDFIGAVEKIGIKTTRLRSVSGEELIVSNSDLTDSRVRNYKRMQERRAMFSFGLDYQTSHENLQAVPGLVKEVVDSHEGTRFDRAHLSKLGTHSLDFEVVYYVLSPDMKAYMDLHQAINLEILARFRAKGIEFAYPTQTVQLRKD